MTIWLNKYYQDWSSISEHLSYIANQPSDEYFLNSQKSQHFLRAANSYSQQNYDIEASALILVFYRGTSLPGGKQ